MRKSALGTRFRADLLSGFVALMIVLPTSASATEKLGNGDIIRMVRAGLSDQVIKAKVEASTSDFDLSTDALIELKKAGVPDSIVALMLSQAQGPAGAEASSLLSSDALPLAISPEEFKRRAMSQCREERYVIILDLYGRLVNFDESRAKRSSCPILRLLRASWCPSGSCWTSRTEGTLEVSMVGIAFGRSFPYASGKPASFYIPLEELRQVCLDDGPVNTNISLFGLSGGHLLEIGHYGAGEFRARQVLEALASIREKLAFLGPLEVSTQCE